MNSQSNTPRVSIIAPAYNAERFLGRCLKSIATQTMASFEVIVVDDGSCDGTAEIAHSFSKADARFRVIVKGKNEGQSAARQDALNVARGEYTIHVDSDDWVESDMLEGLCSVADEKQADMVIFDWIRTTEEGDIYECQRPKSLEPRVILSQMLRPDLHASLCNKLIRRSLYERFHIHFIPGMLMEDQYICLLAQPIHVEYVNKAYYHTTRPKTSSQPYTKGSDLQPDFVPSNYLLKAPIYPISRTHTTEPSYSSPMKDYFSPKKIVLIIPHCSESISPLSGVLRIIRCE